MNSRLWSGKRVTGATRKLTDFETGPGPAPRTVSRCCHAVAQMTRHGGGLPEKRIQPSSAPRWRLCTFQQGKMAETESGQLRADQGKAP